MTTETKDTQDTKAAVEDVAVSTTEASNPFLAALGDGAGQAKVSNPVQLGMQNSGFSIGNAPSVSHMAAAAEQVTPPADGFYSGSIQHLAGLKPCKQIQGINYWSTEAVVADAEATISKDALLKAGRLLLISE